MNNLEPELIEFGQRAYRNYDTSHDWNHALAVEANTRKIIASLPPLNNNNLTADRLKAIRFAAILHDALDHKYSHRWTITPDELDAFLGKHLTNDHLKQVVMFTINNMSWSKQSRLQSAIVEESKHQSFDEEIFHIVRDADWIESIDLQRCIDYNQSVNNNQNQNQNQWEVKGREWIQDVIEHVDDKLLKIRDRLHFEGSRALADPKHQQLLIWRLSHN